MCGVFVDGWGEIKEKIIWIFMSFIGGVFYWFVIYMDKGWMNLIGFCGFLIFVFFIDDGYEKNFLYLMKKFRKEI